MKKVFSLYLAFMIILMSGAGSITVFSETVNESNTINISSNIVENTYSEYISKQDNNFNGNDISNVENIEIYHSEKVAIQDFTDENGILAENALIINENSNLAYSFEVKSSGLYHLNINYCIPEEVQSEVNFNLKIDDNIPFSECEGLVLPRLWKNEDKEIFTDNIGNQYSPDQVAAVVFNSFDIMDSSGVETKPYGFYLSEGLHTISFSDFTDSIIISKVSLEGVSKTISYSEIKNIYENEEYEKITDRSIIIEGEDAEIKTSRSLSPKADNSSPVLTPSSSARKVLNYIGGTNWSSSNDALIWNFNVKKSGLYKLGISFKQDMNINMYSYRVLKIDGKVPFDECNNIKFPYGINWQTIILGNEKEDFWFYLSEGNHTFSLSCTLGETAEQYKDLENIVMDIGDLYLEISMITGEKPDRNRDYDLYRQIPNFKERLISIKERIDNIVDSIKKQSAVKSNSLVSALNNMARVIMNMHDNSFTAQYYVGDYYDNYTSLGSWLYDMKSMPLSIDQIVLESSESEIEFKDVTFFEKMLFSIKRFLYSFTSDYASLSVGEDENKTTIKIWVNWGRDQAQVLNSLIQQSFVKENDIQVNLELTNASLINGMLAGNAPDLSLHLSRTEPVNLAIRGAVYDLTQFEDYNDVVSRFGDSASIPYEYKNGVYALPDTQSFYVMFYRKDILNSLGLDVPQTWDDFISAVSVLQRNNMNAWIPYTQITAASTVNTGVGGLNLFASILQQYGGEFYNSDRNKTTLTGSNVLNAFTYWTNMYTEYKLPTTASFYNRFRTGTMPLGIETYTLCTTLSEAAPEINGRWGIALVPGVKDDNGNINHTVAGSGTGCVILNTSKNKKAAWEFLKWWTSADIQLLYNNNVESILGTVSRTTTATLEAFEGMAWEKRDLKILLEQRSWIKEIPEVPGSYYVSRSVDQAFWNVINEHQTPKDVLKKWGNIADNEVKRKIEEYAG